MTVNCGLWLFGNTGSFLQNSLTALFSIKLRPNKHQHCPRSSIGISIENYLDFWSILSVEVKSIY
jgi:hypothetical protein